MKLVPVLVGEYRPCGEDDPHPAPFCIYYHDINLPIHDDTMDDDDEGLLRDNSNCYYFCADETMDAILGASVKWPQQKMPLHHALVAQKQQHPSRFLIAERLAILARSRSLFALAELASLGLGEIMTGVAAAPLLSSLGIRPITPTHLQDVRVINATSVYSKEQWVTAMATKSNNDNQMATQPHCREEERLHSFMQHLAHHPLWKGMHQPQHDETSSDLWSRFASWFGDYHLHPKQRASFLTTLKTQRQQQAIIQSRQRRLLSTTTAASDRPSSAHHVHQRWAKKRRSNHNTALQQQDDQRSSSSSSLSSRSSTPPLPPPLPMPINHRRFVAMPPGSEADDNNTSIIRSWRSVTELHRPVPCKASSSASSVRLPPPWSNTIAHRQFRHRHQPPRKWASLQDLRGEESNLVLLATQATQRQPLPPLSSPPYHRHHQESSAIQLPPPREMLAHHPPPSGMV